MPRDVASPRKTKIAYVFLFAVVRHTPSYRHGLVKASKLEGYRHQTPITTSRNQWPKLTHVALKFTAVFACDALRMRTSKDRSVDLRLNFSECRVRDLTHNICMGRISNRRRPSGMASQRRAVCQVGFSTYTIDATDGSWKPPPTPLRRLFLAAASPTACRQGRLR
jgi:hypothetical protein